jgi:hypothetical protein
MLLLVADQQQHRLAEGRDVERRWDGGRGHATAGLTRERDAGAS